MGPQAGRAALVAGEQAGRRPQRWVRVQDPVGQALEEMRLVRLDAEVVELHLGLGPGEGGRPLERGRLRGTCRRGRAPRRATRRRPSRRSRGRSRRARADPAAEAEDRVEHRADRVRQRPPVDHRRPASGPNGPGRGSAPGRSRTGSTAPLVLLDRGDVRGPDRRLVAAIVGRRVASSAPMLGDELGLHEQVLEGRVGDVGRLRCEGDLGVRRQLDLARLRAEVGQRHAPDLGVVLGRDDDRQAGRDRAVAARELGVVLGVGDLVAVGLGAARLVARRPDRAGLHVAQEQVAAPRSRGSRPRASGSPRYRASGCSPSRPP